MKKNKTNYNTRRQNKNKYLFIFSLSLLVVFFYSITTNNVNAAISNTTTYTDSVTNLNKFYTDLSREDEHILNTNKFLCTGNKISCTNSSKHTNIALVNVREYERVGGKDSYLRNANAFFSMTEPTTSTVNNITNTTINEVQFSTSSGMRPVVYPKPGLKVTGKGTYSDPYIFKLEEKLADVILKDNPNIKERDDFSNPLTDNTTGTIYKEPGEDGEDTYYFAGNTTNNYVKFGEDSSGHDIYWRIVRINEDGTIRLIYAGTSPTDTNGFIDTGIEFNTTNNESVYSGYMYSPFDQHGVGINSNVKNTLDSWYTNNLSSYDSYISKTAIFCNDRNVTTGSWSRSGSAFNYSPYTRLVTNKTPTFICNDENDTFTANTDTGNGRLKKPIGLITADEVAFAGGVNGSSNTSYYLAHNATTAAWWTMSASNWNGTNTLEFNVASNGSISQVNVTNKIGVRPVINLKACVLIQEGEGTTKHPYVIKATSECLSSEENKFNETLTASAAVNNTSYASVVAPASVFKNVGDSHTFKFNLKTDVLYNSVSGCNGTYNKSTNSLTINNISDNAFCTVNFKKVSLALNSSSTTVYKGNTTYVYINGENYGSLSCSVSNTSYATCSISGNTLRITGVNTGSATVTVRESTLNKTSSIYVQIKPYYTCSSGTLTYNSSYSSSTEGYICVASNAEKRVSYGECVGGTEMCQWPPAHCIVDITPTNNGSDVEEGTEDNILGNAMQSSTLKLSSYTSPLKLTAASSSTDSLIAWCGTSCCYECCPSGKFEDVVTYYCPSGWYTYSGSGSSLRCYRPAVKY